MNFIKVVSLYVIILPLLCRAEQTEQERTLSQELTKAAKQINSQGSQLLDKETMLDSVSTVGNLFVYNNTMINYAANQLDVKHFNSLIEKNVIGTLCAKKELKAFVDLSVVMVYRYLGKNGQFITELSKDMSTCK